MKHTYLLFNKKCGCCKDTFPSCELEKEYLYVYKNYSQSICKSCRHIFVQHINTHVNNYKYMLTMYSLEKISRLVSKTQRNLL